jgi:predicted short-subunit dehydrogenase-like oxidoreductase (DUF2520 family)
MGTSLARALARRGWDLAVIADRDPAAAREARRIVGRGRATADMRRAAARGAGVVFVCVPDDALAGVAQRLARAGGDWAGRTVFHTSGLLSSAALEPLRRRGASVASLHPVQSFPARTGRPRLFRGIVWSVEGDAGTVRLGAAIARGLGGRAVRLSAEAKPLYHAACSVASNFLVALEAAGAGLLADAGFDRRAATRALLPLVQGTLQNVKELGWARALTGPVARGDVRTVRRHLQALAGRPLAGEIYRALAKQALTLVDPRRVPAKKVRALRRSLGGRRPPLPGARRTSRRPAP